MNKEVLSIVPDFNPRQWGKLDALQNTLNQVAQYEDTQGLSYTFNYELPNGRINSELVFEINQRLIGTLNRIGDTLYHEVAHDSPELKLAADFLIIGFTKKKQEREQAQLKPIKAMWENTK